MLSRVADRVFWMARYLERAESIARVAHTFSHLMMDLPKGTEVSWGTLLDIFDVSQEFTDLALPFGEYEVLEFMIASSENVGSIRYAIKSARENARTTRDVLPDEVWESVNELHMYSKEFAEKSVARRNRFKFLNHVVKRCHALNGLMMTTQRRDHTYRFIKLGHLLERVDVTTRVVATVSQAIDSRDRSNPAFDALIWAGFLESLSAIGNYRRCVGPMVEPHSAVNFVFLEPELPRSIVFCLNGIRKALTDLKRHEQALVPIDEALAMLESFDAEKLSPASMHQVVEDLQSCAERLSIITSTTWFLPVTR